MIKRRSASVFVVLAGMTPLPASAQSLPSGINQETGARPGNEIGTGSSLPMSDKASNIAPGDTKSAIAPNLPSPPIGGNASVRDYLVAARSALLLGRTGEAQQALEMAETRALDRSVPLFQTNAVDKSPLVGEIGQALQALGGGDRGRAVQIIEAALPHAN
ncbi:MAG TPA: hypothetical protein VGI78_14105 [Acetobacteraceae bacterium]|jgi:hypothetical protein